MKKFIMTFLVAGLMITSVLCLNSCKKTDTNANVDNEEWVPTFDEFITYEEIQDEGTRDSYVECYYCGFHIPACPDDPPYENHCHFCATHSHVHLELSKTKNEGDKISLVFYLSRHHKHACVFPLGMTQHLVGEVRAASNLVKQFLRFIKLAQLTINLR